MKKTMLIFLAVSFTVMSYGQLTIDNLPEPVRATLVEIYPEIVAKKKNGSYYYPITIVQNEGSYDVQFQTTGPYLYPGWKLDVNSYVTILDNGHLVKYSKFIPNTANLPDDVKAYLIKNHRCVLYGFNVLGGTIFAGRYIFAEMKQYHITFKNWSWIRLNAGTMITADISGLIPVPAPVWYKQYPEKPYTAY